MCGSTSYPNVLFIILELLGKAYFNILLLNILLMMMMMMIDVCFFLLSKGKVAVNKKNEATNSK